jgi:spermidine/putrescine transport system ATP-binding protein
MSANHDVRLEDVTKEFGDLTAVEDIDLSIEQGKFLTLLGPSGCGKTTTLRCIAGFEKPTSGDVYIGDRRVNDLQPFERDTAMVFQSYALFPHMTVGENVAFGLQMQGIPENSTASGTAGAVSRDADGVVGSLKRLARRKGSEEIDARVAETLELVELPGMEDRDIEELSGGQQQRVALARALVTEPTVLLLDEPLGALDLKLRKNMQVELKNLQEELGITFVYVTHDQEEALTMSDEIAIMNDGRIEQVGGVTEIYEQPRTEFVADFIGETNLLRGSYHEDGDGAYIESGDIRYRVPRTDGADGDVAFAVRPEKLRIGDPAAEFGNSFHGTAATEIYTGSIGKFVIRLDNGAEITVDRQIQDEDEYLSIGQTVTLGWKPEKGVVLVE